MFVHSASWAMPEIAFIFAIGSILTFIAVNLNLYLTITSFSRREFVTLNGNLSKIQKYWSNERGQIVIIESGKTKQDYLDLDIKKSKMSAFVFGTILIFLSWVGLFFFVLYYVSVHKIAKSRIEQRIFESELVVVDLPAYRVEEIVNELPE